MAWVSSANCCAGWEGSALKEARRFALFRMGSRNCIEQNRKEGVCSIPSLLECSDGLLLCGSDRKAKSVDHSTFKYSFSFSSSKLEAKLLNLQDLFRVIVSNY